MKAIPLSAWGLIMKSKVVFFLLLFATLVNAQDERRFVAKPLVLTHVTVIDATGAPARHDMTVIIVGDRIKALGKFGKIRTPEGAQVIDASGKFLIPGLWDMHVHTGLKEIFFPLYIANGITGVRDMGGDVDNPTGDFSIRFRLLEQWRNEIERGDLFGPRIIATGPILDGLKARTPSHLIVSNDVDARKAVRTLKALSVDFIKVYNDVPREAYFSIAREARKLGLPFVGHVPIAIRAREASTAGQKSLEHLISVLQGCSTQEDELIGENLKADPSISLRARLRRQAAQAISTYNDQRADSLFKLFVRNHTWQTPTLTALRWPALADGSSLTEDTRLKYIPRAWREGWTKRLKELSPEDIANEKKLFEEYLALVGTMRRAGVRFLAGSNAANPFTYPGFSLHDELVLLVKAGMTPMEALQAATINPAMFLGLTKSLGTIERGKIADLVLLNANPLQDISNTQKIAGVVLRGEFISAQRLQEMLSSDVSLVGRSDIPNRK
jgi:hypothetical protein